MYVAFFCSTMPDNCGAFFSDVTLAKAFQKLGHSVVFISCEVPKYNFAGGT
jgi:hypothetical protein